MNKEMFHGLYVPSLVHIKSISSYNRNYYSYRPDKTTYLMFGLSDDDDLTEWYVIRPTGENEYIGETAVDDRIEVIEERRT